MTQHRIFASARPSLRFGPVQPMSDVDSFFWAERMRRSLAASDAQASAQPSPSVTRPRRATGRGS